MPSPKTPCPTCNGLKHAKAQACKNCRASTEKRRGMGATEYLWSQIDVRGPDECWPWIGRMRGGDGRGYISIDGQRYIVPRLVYELAHGAMPDDKWALHTCDNPPCCNPAHIYPGTPQDNVRDKVERGRTPKGERNGRYTHPETVPRGEKHHKAKLTEADVIEIRRKYTNHEASPNQIAKEYNVSRWTVRRIVAHNAWKGV